MQLRNADIRTSLAVPRSLCPAYVMPELGLDTVLNTETPSNPHHVFEYVVRRERDGVGSASATRLI